MKFSAEFNELTLISKSNRNWPKTAKPEIVRKNAYMRFWEKPKIEKQKKAKDEKLVLEKNLKCRLISTRTELNNNQIIPK